MEAAVQDHTDGPREPLPAVTEQNGSLLLGQPSNNLWQ